MKNPTSGNKYRMRRKMLWPALLLMSLVVWAGPAAYAQNARLDLSHLDKLAKKASKVADVNLDGTMLKLAAQSIAAKEQKGKAAAVPNILERLKGAYIRAFEFSKPGEYTKTDLDHILKQVESGGWKPVINAQEEKSGKSAHIYIMEEGGEAVGLVIVAAEPKKLAVVNLVGPIDFSQLAGLGSLGALGQLGSLGGHSGATKPKLEHRGQSDQNPNPRPSPQREPN